MRVIGGARGTVALWRAHRREILLAGLLYPVAHLLVLFALRLAPVSLVAPGQGVEHRARWSGSLASAR